MLRLKELRKARNETQADIAEVIGITRAAYANIENGRREPDFETLILLSDHFEVSVDYILGRENEKVEIDYLEKKNVKKPNGSKPGFVIYYTNYSLVASPDISEISLISD